MVAKKKQQRNDDSLTSDHYPPDKVFLERRQIYFLPSDPPPNSHFPFRPGDQKLKRPVDGEQRIR